MSVQHFLFPTHPLDSALVEPDFEQEAEMVVALGGQVLLVNEGFLNAGKVTAACRKIVRAETLTPLIYRGWMLKLELYHALYDELIAKNYQLVHAPAEYATCHYFPNSYPFIEKHTPLSVFFPYSQASDFSDNLHKLAVFGDAPIMVKDYVKSEKHHWATACFIPSASDTEKVKTVVANFLTLRGDALNEGLVFRKFEELVPLQNHSKSGLPLTKEFRLFFYQGKLLAAAPYWEEGDLSETELPDIEWVKTLAQQIPASFFSLDIAQKVDNTWIVIEIGDGQTAGLPERMKVKDFYQGLMKGDR